jgi:DNA sulfur modification protein DndD
MKLNKIEMENFLPFYGHAEMDFTPKNGNKIVLLKGENGAGKSSTFTALNFVFFGEPVMAVGEKERLNIHDLVNTKKITESDGTTYVRVHFEHESQQWNFTRKINFKQVSIKKDPSISHTEHANKIRSEKKKNVTIGEFIAVKNGITMPWPSDPLLRNKKQREEIENIIPRDSSKYYFFDGEEISKYTTVPPRDSIKNIIEKLLGIRMIDNAIKDLTELKEKKYDKEIRTLGRANKQTQGYAKTADDKKFVLDMALENKIAKETEVEHQKLEVVRLAAILDKSQNIKKKLDDLAEIESRLNKIEEKLDAEQKGLKKWQGKELTILLSVQFLSKLNTKKQLKPRKQAHLTQTAAHCVEKGKCICERYVDESALDALKELAKKDSSELENFEEAGSVILGKYGTTGLTQSWNLHLTEIQNYLQDKSTLTREKEDINSVIDSDSHSSTEIEEARNDHNIATGNVTKLNNEIDELKKLIEIRQVEYDEAMNDVRKSNVTKPLTEFIAKSKRCKQMIDGFEQTKANVVNVQKKSIENFATEILQKITEKFSGTSKGLQGLHLDDNYTIMIERYVGEPQYTNDAPIPSEGEKQIIAMAFVLALTKFAGIERPIFIDTPFARLDDKFTIEIANAIIEQNEQVIILYQPGELNSDGIQRFREYCSSEWEFTKLSVDNSVVEETR